LAAVSLDKRVILTFSFSDSSPPSTGAVSCSASLVATADASGALNFSAAYAKEIIY
jgi:hypothetical protein